jgi:hypothetical protein
MTAHETLRAKLLVSGLADIVPLAEVETVIVSNGLAETLEAQQKLALSTIRSLLDNGLMVFKGDEDLSVDDAMTLVHDLYVTRHDDPASWVFAMWLKLTDAGRRTAEEIQASRDSD